MTDHYLPTLRELNRIKRLALLRARTLVIVFVTPVILLASVAISRALSDDVSWVLIPTSVLFVSELVLIAYVSFFLRCPRCATWIGLGIPKCASCGLKLGISKGDSQPWHPDMPAARQ